MPYWRDREEANQRLYLLEDDDYVDRLQDIYDYMQDQIQREINGFYTKYLTTEGITYAEATKRVSQLDIDEYQRKAKEYVANRDFSAQANSEMRLYNTTMKINRLELLKSEIGLELVNGFMVIDDEMKAGLTDRAIEEFTRQAGILGKTVINVSEAANSIVNASFRHATFSDRIWMYQDQLKAELDMLLRQGLIQGWNPNEMARHLDKLFDTGKYNCERLMRTELTRVQSDAQLQSFTANGFEWYQFNALGDACPACALLDEQHFRVADAMPGENLPPIHPNCRCAVSAWMDDALYREWLDSYANHGMSYEDWLNNRPLQSEQEEGKINRDYSCELAQALGREVYDAVCDIADACGDENLRRMWDRYHTQISVGDLHYKGTAHARGGAIYIDINDCIKGSYYEKPYQVLFHEASHAIDFKAGTFGHFSVEDAEDDDGVFLTAIKKDIQSRVNARGSLIKQAIKDDDWDALYHMGGVTGFSSQEWYEMWGEYPDTSSIKYSKSMAYESIATDIRKLSPYAGAEVSDIYGGATRLKTNGYFGHKSTYWKNQENVPIEAFAEFSDAAFTNPESLEQLKEYLPEAYKVWQEMVGYLAD